MIGKPVFSEILIFLLELDFLNCKGFARFLFLFAWLFRDDRRLFPSPVPVLEVPSLELTTLQSPKIVVCFFEDITL